LVEILDFFGARTHGSANFNRFLNDGIGLVLKPNEQTGIALFTNEGRVTITTGNMAATYLHIRKHGVDAR
jgi:hypothetical protein